MSNYVWDSHLSYQDYLQARNFVHDVTSATHDAGKQVSMEISRQTREVIASNEALSRDNIRVMEANTAAITAGFEQLSYGLSEISFDISELNSTFHWGFGQLISSLGHMNDALSELIKIAKTPVQTVAFNHFEIARDAFRKGLYQESLEELEKAISGDHTSAGYKLEWRFHQMKGTLLLGFVDCDMSLYDLTKAEESFLIAARYGKTDYPEDAGRAFLSAGWAAYCQGKMKEALTYTEQAMAIHPKLGEAFFQAAKIQMSKGQVDTALSVLSEAIDLDRGYALKAAGDGDFQPHDKRLRDFLEVLRVEKYRQCVPKTQAALERIRYIEELSPTAATNKSLNRLKAFMSEGGKWPLMDMLYVVQNLDSVVAEATRVPIIAKLSGPIEETYYEDFVIKPGGFFKKAVTERRQKTRIVSSRGAEIDIEFCSIPAGTFMMGKESADASVSERHQVTITKDFLLGKYQVTQAQWQVVMGTNPSHFKGATLPVEMVSWDDCQAFVNELNGFAGKNIYRLPTEAEWEYACRAGSTSTYCFGDNEGRLGEYAWYYGQCEYAIHPVGQKKPNAWGLYDMHGNVVEWCQDWYGGLSVDSVTDPTGASSGQFRVLRGGAWNFTEVDARSACRFNYRSIGEPDLRGNYIGFRLVRSTN